MIDDNKLQMRYGTSILVHSFLIIISLLLFSRCSQHVPDMNENLVTENRRLIRENEELRKENRDLKENVTLLASLKVVTDTIVEPRPEQLLPPIIVNKYYWKRESDKKYEAVVFLMVKADLEPYTKVPYFILHPDEVPVVGRVLGSVSRIIIAGVEVRSDDSGEIYCRLPIALGRGYNRIPVKVEARSGRVAKGYMEVEVGY